MLEAAVVAAARGGLVAPKSHVVVLQQIHEDFCVKVMSLDSSGSRVVGGKVKMMGRSITGFKTVGSARSGSTGALVDSDDEAEDEADQNFLCAAGSFQASASMLYKANAAGLVSAAVPKGAPGLATPRAVASPCSPDTPIKLGSGDTPGKAAKPAGA
eukprot:GHRQ01009901.1.p2 GENE.GHRQ01009901.1~~GHRQ01009901.1.p2  ORF type:complete len:184 (+),score=88.40 GHRQ01009901.1:82-552(+)